MESSVSHSSPGAVSVALKSVEDVEDCSLAAEEDEDVEEEE